MNKINNKPLIRASILIFTLILLLSTFAFAKPFTDAFRGGLIDINNFFTGEKYKPYANAIDFFFFSLLFIAIYMMGARYAFKEVKKPEQVIVILLGLMTAFLLVLGGFSATLLLPYIHWLLYTLLFIFYWWLLKGIKSKFWRFILALLLTLLTIGLLQGLFAAIAPEAEIPAFFKDLGAAFKGIQFPELPGPPGVPPALRDLFGPPTVVTPTPPTTLPPTVTPPTPPEEKGLPWWIWLLLIPLLAGAGFLGYKNWDRVKSWFGRRPPTAAEERAAEERREEGLAIEQILSQIEDYLNKKKNALINIYRIYKTKKDLNQDLIDLYQKTLYNIEPGKIDPAYLLDPEHPVHKKFLQEETVVNTLIKQEIELEKQLAELLQIEYKLSGVKSRTGPYGIEREGGDLEKWQNAVRREFIKSPEFMSSQKTIYQEAARRLMFYLTDLVNVTDEAKINIQNYFRLTKIHIAKEKELKELLDSEKLKNWVQKARVEKWKDLIEMKTRESRDFSRISRYLNKDEPSFLKTELYPAINKERSHLKYILWLIKYLQSNAEIKIVIQDLVVEPAEAKQKPGVMYGTFIKISTKISQGIAPFKAYCYIYKKEVDIDYSTGTILKEWYVQIFPEKPPRILKRTAESPQIDTSQIEFEFMKDVKASSEYQRQLNYYTKIVEFSSKTYEKILGEIVFTSKDFGNLEPGEYKVVFFVRGSAEIKRYNWDKKETDIFIKHRPEIEQLEFEFMKITKGFRNLLLEISKRFGGKVAELAADITGRLLRFEKLFKKAIDEAMKGYAREMCVQAPIEEVQQIKRGVRELIKLIENKAPDIAERLLKFQELIDKAMEQAFKEYQREMGGGIVPITDVTGPLPTITPPLTTQPPRIRINLMDAVNRERTLLKRIANSIGKLIERMPRRRKEIDEEGIADIEETARRTAQELEEFQDKEIFEKYPRETLHEKSKKIYRRVKDLISRLVKLKGVKDMTRAAAELERLEEERVRALGEIPAAPPHVYTPPTPELVPPVISDVAAFFNDLFTALRNERFDEVNRLCNFAIDNRIWTISQFRSFGLFSFFIERRNFYTAKTVLSYDDFKRAFEPFKPNVNVIEELSRIVEELKARHQPAQAVTPTVQPPISEEQLKNDIIQLHNSGDFETLRTKYSVIILTFENWQEMLENPDATPLFVPSGAGSYLLIKTFANRGFVVPKISVFTYDYVRFGAVNLIFGLRGYRSGYIYRRIQVIKPAIFETVGDKWGISEKGILELGAEEPET